MYTCTVFERLHFFSTSVMSGKISMSSVYQLPRANIENLSITTGGLCVCVSVFVCIVTLSGTLLQADKLISQLRK